MTYAKACRKVSKCYNHAKLTEYQVPWLNNEPISDENIEKFRPVNRTPQDHNCYKMSDLLIFLSYSSPIDQIFEGNKNYTVQMPSTCTLVKHQKWKLQITQQEN